jgi:glycerophosphoryl diester phosphodiesterase
MTKNILMLLKSIIIAVSLFMPQESSSNQLIIAHRGAAGHAPENTLSAVRKAIEMHADAVEIDVRQTRDSQIVAMHDEDVDRTTNGKGDVRELTLRELKQFDAGTWFSENFKDERVPTLQEIIDVLDSTTKLIVELKEGAETSPDIEQRVVDIVEKNNLGQRVILKSFDREVLSRIRVYAPEIPLLYVYVFAIPLLNLTVDQGISAGDLLKMDVEYLQPHKIFLTQSFISSAKEKGYKVIAWDVKTEANMKDIIALGVDGIETDYPDVLFSVIQQKENTQ